MLAGKSVSNLPLIQGSGSTAAATLWRSIIANASATGNAPFSLTYDAVGSGQVWHRFLHYLHYFGGVCISEEKDKCQQISSQQATEDFLYPVQGQKSLFSRAYDYAVSDVPIASAVYNGLDRYAGVQRSPINGILCNV